jgi:hypothetical protein
VASPKISTLSESFDGLALNAGIWNTNTPAGTTLGLSNGTLQIQIAAGTNTAAGYPSITTVGTYDLTNSAVSIQLPQQGTPTTGYENWPLLVQVDNNNATYAVLSGGFIGVYKKVAGVQTSVWFGTYDPVTIQWVRVRESGGTVYWESSFDGHAWATWTNLPNPWAVTDLQVRIQAGTWQVVAPTETANFDNLNYNPNYVPRDWRVALVTAGAPPTYQPPQWDFLLYGPGSIGTPTDPATWGQLSDLVGAKSRHVEVSLNETSSATFSVSGFHPDATLVQELGTDLRIERNGTAVFRGRIGPATDDIDEDNHTCGFTAYDYREMLKSKIVLNDITTGAVDVEAAVWNALSTAQARTNGTLGITRAGAASGVTITSQVLPRNSTVFDAADQFRVANGVEWDVDPGLVYRVYPSQRGSTTNWLADFGGSVKRVTRSVDVNGYANFVQVTGSSTGFTGSAATADVNANASSIGRWEKAEGNLDYGSANQAQAAANSWVGTDAQVIPGYDLTLYNGVWGGPTDLWVGDRIHVVVQVGRLNVDTTLRVLKIAIDINEEGEETVVVTVGQLSTIDAFYKAHRKVYAALTQLTRR